MKFNFKTIFIVIFFIIFALSLFDGNYSSLIPLALLIFIGLVIYRKKSNKNNKTKKKGGFVEGFIEGFNSKSDKKVSKKNEDYEEIDSDKKVSKKNEDYEEIDYESNASRKKSGLGSFLAGGIAANKISSPGIPPTITFEDPNVVIMGIRPKGREWSVKVGRREGGKVKQLGNFTVSKQTSSGHSYGGNYRVYHSK